MGSRGGPKDGGPSTGNTWLGITVDQFLWRFHKRYPDTQVLVVDLRFGEAEVCVRSPLRTTVHRVSLSMLSQLIADYSSLMIEPKPSAKFVA